MTDYRNYLLENLDVLAAAVPQPMKESFDVMYKNFIDAVYQIGYTARIIKYRNKFFSNKEENFLIIGKDANFVNNKNINIPRIWIKQQRYPEGEYNTSIWLFHIDGDFGFFVSQVRSYLISMEVLQEIVQRTGVTEYIPESVSKHWLINMSTIIYPDEAFRRREYIAKCFQIYDKTETLGKMSITELTSDYHEIIDLGYASNALEKLIKWVHVPYANVGKSTFIPKAYLRDVIIFCVANAGFLNDDYRKYIVTSSVYENELQQGGYEYANCIPVMLSMDDIVGLCKEYQWKDGVFHYNEEYEPIIINNNWIDIPDENHIPVLVTEHQYQWLMNRANEVFVNGLAMSATEYFSKNNTFDGRYGHEKSVHRTAVENLKTMTYHTGHSQHI